MTIQLSNIKPLVLNEEQAQAVNEAVKSQDISRHVAKSYDEVNYPVWSTIVNDGALVYIPDFAEKELDKNGNKVLKTEHVFQHAISLPSQFMQVRSTMNLVGLESVGITGNDPLQDAVSKNWDLYNLTLANQAKQLGLDPKDKENETLAQFRRDLLDKFTVKPANEYRIFPIVVIETEVEDGVHSPRKIILDDNKMPIFKVYWFQISETRFDQMFMSIEKTMEEGDYLGGNFYHFNYDTGKKLEDLKNPRMQSGLAFKPTLINFKSDQTATRKLFDEAAKEFTPAKARETVIAATLLPDEIHKQIADEAILPVQEKLDTLEAMSLVNAGATAKPDASSAEQTLENFGGNTTADASKQLETKTLDAEAGTMDFA